MKLLCQKKPQQMFSEVTQRLGVVRICDHILYEAHDVVYVDGRSVGFLGFSNRTSKYKDGKPF